MTVSLHSFHKYGNSINTCSIVIIRLQYGCSSAVCDATEIFNTSITLESKIQHRVIQHRVKKPKHRFRFSFQTICVLLSQPSSHVQYLSLVPRNKSFPRLLARPGSRRFCTYLLAQLDIPLNPFSELQYLFLNRPEPSCRRVYARDKSTKYQAS